MTEPVFTTTIIKPPWAEVTPDEALRWLDERFQDWQGAANTLVAHSEIPRNTAYWLLDDVKSITCACIQSVKTHESAKLRLEDDADEPENIVLMLAQAVQCGSLEAADGASFDAFADWSQQLVERLAVSPTAGDNEEEEQPHDD